MHSTRRGGRQRDRQGSSGGAPAPLEGRGDKVFAPTLTGVGERAHLLGRGPVGRPGAAASPPCIAAAAAE
jgi:hypothetical protein